MSLYKGKRKFTREQAIFVVECALIGALDRIESGLPTFATFEDRNEAGRVTSLTSYENGALECAGMALGVFYAQITDDGLGIMDALECAEYDGRSFYDACQHLVSESWKNDGKDLLAKQQKLVDEQDGSYTTEQLFGDLWPNTRKHAEGFVSRLFSEGDFLDQD